jgi:hypothetical protein
MLGENVVTCYSITYKTFRISNVFIKTGCLLESGKGFHRLKRKRKNRISKGKDILFFCVQLLLRFISYNNVSNIDERRMN